ncbi:MAG: glycerate kinase [Treponemataceae bacterium]|nr:glycerate kinase [Treponemataceae bacterium]
MKFVIAPDSFKGSISAEDFCHVAEKVIAEIMPDPDVMSMPLADGGEGTMACILSVLEGWKEKIQVTGAFLGGKKWVEVGFVNESREAATSTAKTAVSTNLKSAPKTAIIESAEAMGLPSVGDRKNPALTTTYGVGEMIAFAIESGAKKIILTLGGSSTNDCGSGMLAALGASFCDKEGRAFVPTGGTLRDVAFCDFTALKKKLSDIEIVAMCDVNNPLCGELGCSAVYGPQKGADEEMVSLLDSGCRHFAQLVEAVVGKDYSSFPGAGAAGGLGFACIACMGGTLQSGIETILDLYGFEAAAGKADYIITGEGHFDEQSLMGKTIGGILKKARLARAGSAKPVLPVVVFCGKAGPISGAAFPELSIHEISKGQDLEYAMAHGKENLERELTAWLRSL